MTTPKERSWKWSGERKTTEEMDAMAAEAQNDLVNFDIDFDQLEKVRDWMEKWFQAGCGWKRLAKVLAKGI